MLVGIMQPGWDPRGAANTFLDQLTGWERRIQEYEGVSLETFSDGMKIAVLAPHAPGSIRNVVRLAAGPGRWEVSSGGPAHVRVSSVGQIFDKDGRGMESERSSANATPMDVDAVGKGTGKGCFVCGRPAHASEGKAMNMTDKNSFDKSQMGRLPKASGRNVIWAHSIVQLRNANGLSIPSDRYTLRLLSYKATSKGVFSVLV